MRKDFKNIFIRLVYALRKNENNTIILGAGCSLTSSKNNVSFKALMEKTLTDHGVYDSVNFEWDKLYKEFINIVWEGKGTKERENLLKKVFSNMNPSVGYYCLRQLVEKGCFSTIITTNVDMMLEKSLAGLSYRKKVGNNDYVIIGENPTFDLIKAHGDIENGELRFSPTEIMNLPEDLYKTIYERTEGIVLVIGYKGQDNGLMNSLNRTAQYAAYWADINELDICDAYTIKPIIDFMNQRNSINNFLFGNEYGSFDSLLQQICDYFFSKHNNTIISKEQVLGSEWKHTTIVDLLKLYGRLYELFLDLLDIIKSEQKKLCDTNTENTDIYYNEYLYSYLYFFNSEKLPAYLLHIPNNELDAMLLGISLDIKARSIYYNLNAQKLINAIKNSFCQVNCNPIIDESFWNTIENIVCDSDKINEKITVDMNNHLKIISYEIPIVELIELMHIIDFLSLFIPYQDNGINIKMSLYQIKNQLSTKYESLVFNENKILINLGRTNIKDIELLNNLYIKKLPDVKKPITRNIKSQEWMIIDSKWIEIRFLPDAQKSNHMHNIENLYDICKERSNQTTNNFIKLSSPFGIKSGEKLDLQLSIDIKKFIQSNKSAMFIIGTSGRGKTIALKKFVCDNKNNDDTLTIVLTPKNMIINKMGLDLFLDLDLKEYLIPEVLRHINSSCKIRNQKIILIFDAINEISDVYEIQEAHYRKLLDLAGSIYSSNSQNIKLIITCRESVYFRYKSSTGLHLNPIYFITNKELSYECENINDNDFAYKLVPLSASEKSDLMLNYGILPEKIKSDIFLSELYEQILNEDITPLFIAIAGETIMSKTGIRRLKSGEDIYDIFTDLMLDRLDELDVFLTKKIIYTYFDLLIEYRKTNIEINYFKILDRLPFQYHKEFGKMITKMQDVNIITNDCSAHKRIKFSHDKIEEYFFKEYIKEFSDNGDAFFENIIELMKKNVIYRSGIIQYFKYLIDNNALAKFKELSILISTRDMDDSLNIIVESLCLNSNIKNNLEYLLDENDLIGSQKMLKILILGIENLLPIYPMLRFNLNKIIENLLELNTKIITEIDLTHLMYFKSRIMYFIGEYEQAIDYIEKSKLILSDKNLTLKSILNKHQAVILLEQGYSKKSVDLLRIEFEYYKSLNDFAKMVEIGIELGRGLCHCGQINEVLELYSLLLSYEEKIDDLYVISKLYGRKANALNKKMYHLLKYGIVSSDTLSKDEISCIDDLFYESVDLYKCSMDIENSINDMFTYTGVVPELINTYVSYSFMSNQDEYIKECKKLIEETDKLFELISTPYQVDFFLSKAYYLEYIENISLSEAFIEKALFLAKKMKIKNKIARCNSSYAYFAYRCLKKYYSSDREKHWKTIGYERIIKAINYYKENTIINNNIALEDDMLLLKRFAALTENII